MNFTPKVKKFQQGGAMEQAPVEQGVAPEATPAEQENPLLIRLKNIFQKNGKI